MIDTPVFTGLVAALVAADHDSARSQHVHASEAGGSDLRLFDAAGGADACDAVLDHAPAVCFLDVRMPGLTGIDVARRVDDAAHVVIVVAPGAARHAVPMSSP